MKKAPHIINDLHRLMDMLQQLDVGIMVLDREFKVQLWNGFMQHYSGKSTEDVLGKTVFDCFPEADQPWFTAKAETSFELGIYAFSSWEQHPYLFKFKHAQIVSTTAPLMHQNLTIIPLKNTRGDIDNICLVIHDVSELAAANGVLNKGRGH